MMLKPYISQAISGSPTSFGHHSESKHSMETDYLHYWDPGK